MDKTPARRYRHRSDDARLIEAYATIAPRYDQRWESYINASITETLRRLSLLPGMRVLDVGCGTGILLSEVFDQQPTARLAGVDQSSEMLGVAFARLGERAELHVGTAENLPFEDESFDIVICTNMLHFVREKTPVLAEFARVLVPNGTVVITDWCRDYLVIRAQDLWSRLFARTHSTSLSARECSVLLRKAGFRCPRIDRYRISSVWGLMTAIADA